MGLEDKIRNAKDKVFGGAKDKLGDSTNNPDLQAGGQGQETAGHAKQAGEDVKDAAKNATDGLK
jgi:uncharacterized protein YjbJ (UPF0337 family)